MWSMIRKFDGAFGGIEAQAHFPWRARRPPGAVGLMEATSKAAFSWGWVRAERDRVAPAAVSAKVRREMRVQGDCSAVSACGQSGRAISETQSRLVCRPPSFPEGKQCCFFAGCDLAHREIRDRIVGAIRGVG